MVSWGVIFDIPSITAQWHWGNSYVFIDKVRARLSYCTVVLLYEKREWMMSRAGCKNAILGGKGTTEIGRNVGVSVDPGGGA